jgi:hypothetical protein
MANNQYRMDFDCRVAHLWMIGILMIWLSQVLEMISIHIVVPTLTFLPPNFELSLHKSWSGENKNRVVIGTVVHGSISP